MPPRADNRRMDEWVTLDQLDLSSVQVESVEEQDGPGGRWGGRNKGEGEQQVQVWGWRKSRMGQQGGAEC